MNVTAAEEAIASLRRIRARLARYPDIMPGTEEAGRAWCKAAQTGDLAELARAEDAVLMAWAEAQLRAEHGA